MKLNFLERFCRNCKISLTEFEVTEKNSLCMDCYQEETEDKMEPDKKPMRLKNKRLFA